MSGATFFLSEGQRLVACSPGSRLSPTGVLASLNFAQRRVRDPARMYIFSNLPLSLLNSIAVIEIR